MSTIKVTSDKKKPFEVGELIRWSNPRNQNGNPAFYGMVYKANLRTVAITFLASGSHKELQPTYRNETWMGGKTILWDGPYEKEELIEIATNLQQSTGWGWKTKYITKWDPNCKLNFK